MADGKPHSKGIDSHADWNVITIDGPSGSGKSTLSRLLAAKLSYAFLDTGAMYRAVGLAVERQGIALDDETALTTLLDRLDLRLVPVEGMTRVYLDGEDVSEAIRTAAMGMAASRVSAIALVRRRLVAMQQEIGRSCPLVAEGRDMGTVVFPRARYKFFLDAAPEERARRRTEELKNKGHNVAYDDILAQINQRDRDDAMRTHSPLKAAADARIVDSSTLSIEDVLDHMLQIISSTTA